MSDATDTPNEHKPPTPTARLHEVTMAALNRRPSEPVSDVTISRNAKGDFQFEVTVRGVSAEACHVIASSLAGQLREQYPHSSEVATPAAEGERVKS